MSKADVIEIEGTVVEKLPNAFVYGKCYNAIATLLKYRVYYAQTAALVGFI